MIKVLAVQSSIYDHFHDCDGGLEYFLKAENRDSYAAYYTSMYIIQDTAEAISTHMERGFSQDPMLAYLEFWGVMQAVVMQQDAICELHKAVTGKRPQVKSLVSWWGIRHKRDLCVGHPANRSRGVPAPQRTFMGRAFGDYGCISYELFDAATGQITHPVFDMRKLIVSYDDEASQILQHVLANMATQWPRRLS